MRSKNPRSPRLRFKFTSLTAENVREWSKAYRQPINVLFADQVVKELSGVKVGIYKEIRYVDADCGHGATMCDDCVDSWFSDPRVTIKVFAHGDVQQGWSKGCRCRPCSESARKSWGK